jgi:hypothetical protein
MAYAAERNVNHISALVMASGLVVLVGAYRAYTASITADGTINSMLVRTTWSTPAGRTGKVSAVDVLGNRLELEFDDGRKDRFDIIALRPVAI